MKIQRFRKFNTRDVYPGGRHDNDMCMTVRADNRIYLRGQTGFDLDQRMRDPTDPAAQADQAMENAGVLLEEAGSSLDHVTMVTTYLTDPAWRVPVYKVVAEHLRGNHTVGTGLIVKGLALPEMKVEIDLEAVIPVGGPHRKHRLMNSRDWFGQGEIDRDSCWLVDSGAEIFLRGQTGAEFDGRTMHGTGFTVADAAAQADQAMKNARVLLEEAGSGFHDVMKTRIYIGDRAYREAVYQTLGKHFGDTYPCSTGLIMRGFARPEILFEIDMAIIREPGHAAPAPAPVPHRRGLPGRTEARHAVLQVGAGRQRRAPARPDRLHPGRRVPVSRAIPAAQADQAMRNIAVLLEEAGASMNDVCKIHTFIAAPRPPRDHLPRRRAAPGGRAPVRHRHHRRRLRPARDSGRSRRGGGDSGLSPTQSRGRRTVARGTRGAPSQCAAPGGTRSGRRSIDGPVVRRSVEDDSPVTRGRCRRWPRGGRP